MIVLSSKWYRKAHLLKKETFWPFEWSTYFTSLQTPFSSFSFITPALFNQNQQFLSVFEGCWQASSAYYSSYWTKTYRLALMCWSPLSPLCWASLPPVPNPILESQELQTFWLLATISILALEPLPSVHSTLNPFFPCQSYCFCSLGYHTRGQVGGEGRERQ